MEIELDTSLPWEGYRYFKVEVNNTRIYMTSESVRIQWNILKNGTMMYKEKPSKHKERNELKRVWKKINYN